MFLFFLFISLSVEFSSFLNLIPNSNNGILFKYLIVPCPSDIDCNKQNKCKAPGHLNCFNGKLDKFGIDFKNNIQNIELDEIYQVF